MARRRFCAIVPTYIDIYITDMIKTTLYKSDIL